MLDGDLDARMTTALEAELQGEGFVRFGDGLPIAPRALAEDLAAEGFASAVALSGQAPGPDPDGEPVDCDELWVTPLVADLFAAFEIAFPEPEDYRAPGHPHHYEGLYRWRVFRAALRAWRNASSEVRENTEHLRAFTRRSEVLADYLRDAAWAGVTYDLRGADTFSGYAVRLCTRYTPTPEGFVGAVRVAAREKDNDGRA